VATKPAANVFVRRAYAAPVANDPTMARERLEVALDLRTAGDRRG
jgi:hypothetical protein